MLFTNSPKPHDPARRRLPALADMRPALSLIAGLVLALSMAAPVSAQGNRFANVTIETVPVSGGVSMLIGAGGNIGVSAGEDGILIIDDQFAPLAGRIKAALAELGSDVPQFVLNTHFHGDHVGGNAEFGIDSLIVAHENVRRRMQAGNAVPEALPVVTYEDGVTIHFNGEEISVIHLPTGHTDTDSVVLFSESNVIHMGDLFFNGGFPFVDLNNGGNLQGYMDNLRRALAMIDNDTAVIPGHGPLATKADLRRFYNMIQNTSETILAMKADGLSADEAVDKGLHRRYASWGRGFINEERWIRTVYDSE